MTITATQREILHHTKCRAVNRMYCGARNDPDLVALCDGGLMRYAGYKGWLPPTDGYFTITDAGVSVLQERGEGADR